MPLLWVSLVLLAFSTTPNVAAPLPLPKATHGDIVPNIIGDGSNPLTQTIEPNTLIQGVPNDFFPTPIPSDPPPLYFIEKENFGLWPSGHTVPEKTVLLNMGEARFDATFKLVLREGEDLKGMRHRPNDTSVITSFEESRERRVERFVTYNITITHHFKGTVGVAEYELTILTTMGATLRAAGTYYVSGAVIYASTDYKPIRIVSGKSADPLAVQSMYSFSNMMKNGNIMLPLKLQQAGPDVRRKRETLADVLSTAKITVESTPSEDMAILMSNGDKCNATDKKISIRQRDRSSWSNCDVGFDYKSMSLVLRLHPESHGKAVIEISFPSLRTDREAFKTEIRLMISKPAIRKPELILRKIIHLQFDYYGTESFSLQLRNMKDSNHRKDALSYVLDLPGNRYATADFSSSSLAGPVQNISFTVISPGQENKILQKKIRHALMSNTDSLEGEKDGKAGFVNLRRVETRANESRLLQGHRESRGTSIAYPSLPSLALYDNKDYLGDFGIISGSKMEKTTHGYRSHVHAVFPSFNELVTLPIPANSALLTSIASKKVALVEALRVQIDHQNVLVKFFLLRYTISTFSQHKSVQISTSLSKEVSSLFRIPIQPATLIMLEDRGLNVEATYHILVPQKYTDAVMDIHKHKKNICSSITNIIFLKGGRIMISEVERLAVLGRPTTNATAMEEHPRYIGVSGTLVAIIVVISVIIVIPLLTACIGYLLALRYRDQNFSSSDSDSRPETPQEQVKASKSKEDPQAASDVLRDNYGRADQNSYESFKVRKEISQQGYFGDKICPGKEEEKSLASS